MFLSDCDKKYTKETNTASRFCTGNAFLKKAMRVEYRSIALIMMVTVLVSISKSFRPTAFYRRTGLIIPRWSQRDLGTRTHNYCSTSTSLFSTPARTTGSSDHKQVPLYKSEGIFAVNKPIDWTSSDVVSYIRGILERDARERGARPVRVGSRRNKSRIVKVGHGGTLDPLATGVLVIGVGKGTKELQTFLSGSKRYRAGAELGYETNTLDLAGNVTKRAPFDHITMSQVEKVIPEFIGRISQVPPIFSAIQKDGKRLYEAAREGKNAEDVGLEAREVEVNEICLVNQEKYDIPFFHLEIDCGGGTYIRSLLRDIAYRLDSVATTVCLERTKQGQFTLDGALEKGDWTPDNIYAAIDRVNEQRAQAE